MKPASKGDASPLPPPPPPPLGSAFKASEYALKYGVFHLCMAARSGGEMWDLLVDVALRQWSFLGQVFQAGHGSKMVRALGDLEAARNSSAPGGTRFTDYAMDALQWLRRGFNDFELHPERMEETTLGIAPLCSPKVSGTMDIYRSTFCQLISCRD